jgi:hypothetical protein
MNTRFDKLFEPGKIGTLEIKNRIIMAAMGTRWADKDGKVVQRQLDYHGERARGGTGMVCTEACCVQTPVGRGFEQISLDDDKYLPGLEKLAEKIKTNGARAKMRGSCETGHHGNPGDRAENRPRWGDHCHGGQSVKPDIKDGSERYFVSEMPLWEKSLCMQSMMGLKQLIFFEIGT